MRVIQVNIARNNAKGPDLYKIDYGTRIMFTGLELPEEYEVHFSKSKSDLAISQLGDVTGVNVPDSLLLSEGTLYGWLYVHTGEDDGWTKREFSCAIKARSNVGYTDATPKQQTLIEQAIIKLGEILKEMGAVNRVSALEGTNFASREVIEIYGIPEYVSDVSKYEQYEITETGWYGFFRVECPSGVDVTAYTTVEGADSYVVGLDYVDVAIRFGVTAESKRVTIQWNDEYSDSYLFKAADLANRNLDYRTTFYLYDLSPFCEWQYALTTDTTFVANKKYYTKDGDEYVLAEVTAGETIPADTYYTHSKLHLEGMVRNVTYKLDEIVDCPIEIALPTVTDAGYGAWFELQMRYDGSYSCTLLPPSSDVKVGTAQTQAQTAGINTIDLQYTGVGGAKLWTLLNTHSNIPT